MLIKYQKILFAKGKTETNLIFKRNLINKAKWNDRRNVFAARRESISLRENGTTRKLKQLKMKPACFDQPVGQRLMNEWYTFVLISNHPRAWTTFDAF